MTQKKETMRFIMGECLRNLRRNVVRYLLFGCLVCFCTVVYSVFACVSLSADEILDEYLPICAPDGYYIPEEDIAGYASLPYSIAEVQAVDEAADFAEKILWVTALLTVLLLHYIFKFNTDLRMKEAAVMLSVGVSGGTIAAVFFGEMLIFACTSYTSGILAGSFAACLLWNQIAEPVMQWHMPHGWMLTVGYAVILLLLIVRIWKTRKKLTKCTPRELCR